jgi:site-specific DNA-adenine methylase
MPTAKQDAWKPMAAPFPYFGGKRRAAALIWERFGDVQNYVEPFFGSGAVLLGRPPGFRGTETVNDKDCYLANFWRALKNDPSAVCEHCDWPVNEIDLHARHAWLLDRAEFRERMRADPKYYDVEIAGIWVWGTCQWIGSGWCEERFYNGQQLPHLGDAGMGVHRPSQQLPHLGAGRGVHRPSQKLPHLGAGRGVHRPSQKRPMLHNGGAEVHRTSQDLLEYLTSLANRLRRVRVCCGDWSRVCGRTPLRTVEDRGVCAVFLDPPYSGKVRDNSLYGCEDLEVSSHVREWAIKHGNDSKLRICLAGYDTEHEMPKEWERVAGKAGHGYGGQCKTGYKNKDRERLWFSPACLRP